MRSALPAALFSLAVAAAAAAQDHPRFSLWPNGAPGSEARRHEADFAIFVYPGPLAVPASFPPNAPPAFLVAASDDPCCAVPTLTLLRQYRDAGVPVEAHVPAKGGHGFNMGQRSPLRSVNTWPDRLADWLLDTGLARNVPADEQPAVAEAGR